jgi:hypothetical protein
VFRCPNCGENSIGWFHKLTSGTWGPCECRACGMLSRESRIPRTVVSIVELGTWYLVFTRSPIENPGVWALLAATWLVLYGVTESICLYNIPLVPASKKWEKAKDILSWTVVAGLVAIIALSAIVFIK